MGLEGVLAAGGIIVAVSLRPEARPDLPRAQRLAEQGQQSLAEPRRRRVGRVQFERLVERLQRFTTHTLILTHASRNSCVYAHLAASNVVAAGSRLPA